jgi:hypothetical protein
MWPIGVSAGASAPSPELAACPIPRGQGQRDGGGKDACHAKNPHRGLLNRSAEKLGQTGCRILPRFGVSNQRKRGLRHQARLHATRIRSGFTMRSGPSVSAWSGFSPLGRRSLAPVHQIAVLRQTLGAPSATVRAWGRRVWRQGCAFARRIHLRRARNASTSLRRWHFEIRLGSPPCFRAG